MQAAEFDEMAATYDEDFTHTLVGSYQRQQVWHYLDNNLPNIPLKVLELNCGTGEDALWMAKKGHQVHATDISSQMVSVAQHKLEEAGFGHKASSEVLAIAPDALTTLPGQYDIIFSNFGGWNCLSPQEIQAVAKPLAARVAPGGRMLAVIMPDRCTWEMLYFFSRGRWSDARRRVRRYSQFTPPGRDPMDIYYFRPKQFAQAFSPYFKLRKIQGVGLWVPPSYLNQHLKSFPKALAWAQRRDLAGATKRWPRWADHCVVDVERTDVEV
ncbi:MAG: class I SAM-dependent methyltransferase [Bacteroidota bacterium]